MDKKIWLSMHPRNFGSDLKITQSRYGKQNATRGFFGGNFSQKDKQNYLLEAIFFEQKGPLKG